MSHICKTILTGFLHLLSGKSTHRKNNYYLLYCQFAVKYLFFWKLLHIPLHSETLFGYKLQFFHYSIFLSLFEDMHLSDEYFVQLGKYPTIIDLGSEVGLSVFYFKSIYPHAKIYAFEPDPSSYKLLIQNIKRNNLKNVFSYNVAVASKRGLISFFVDPIVNGSLTMSLYPQRQQKKMKVAADRLSHYVKNKIDLLKMDIEGAELSVLEDLARSKKISLIKMMIIEYHHHIEIDKNNLSHLLSILEKARFGYQIRAKYKMPFQKRQYQDFLIFAYKS